MPPPPKVPPRRERCGWVRTEMGSRHFYPGNHGLRYLPAFMAMFAFSHATLHANLRFSALLTLEKPVSERICRHAFPPGGARFSWSYNNVTRCYRKSYVVSCYVIPTYVDVTKLQEFYNIHTHVNVFMNFHSSHFYLFLTIVGMLFFFCNFVTLYLNRDIIL